MAAKIDYTSSFFGEYDDRNHWSEDLGSFDGSMTAIMGAVHQVISCWINGGFWLVFNANTGQGVPESIKGFITIKAHGCASIVEQAKGLLFGATYPRDHKDREKIIFACSDQVAANIDDLADLFDNYYKSENVEGRLESAAKYLCSRDGITNFAPRYRSQPISDMDFDWPRIFGDL